MTLSTTTLLVSMTRVVFCPTLTMDRGRTRKLWIWRHSVANTSTSVRLKIVPKTRVWGETKQLGTKNTLHCAVWHHQLEKWFREEKSTRPGLEEVYDAVVTAREEEGTDLEEMPAVILEEMHTCMICKG